MNQASSPNRWNAETEEEAKAHIRKGLAELDEDEGIPHSLVVALLDRIGSNEEETAYQAMMASLDEADRAIDREVKNSSKKSIEKETIHG